MRFTEVTDEGIIRSVANGYKRAKIFCRLDEFQESGMKVAEVDISDYKSATSCTASIHSSIKRYGFANIAVCTSDGETYLINKEKIDV